MSIYINFSLTYNNENMMAHGEYIYTCRRGDGASLTCVIFGRGGGIGGASLTCVLDTIFGRGGGIGGGIGGGVGILEKKLLIYPNI